MQNEPQLSAEMEAKFEKMWTEGTGLHDRAKHFLATALEEQRASMIAEIEGWADENQMSPFANLGSTKYVRYAKLRAKLVEMKEGK